jgi:DHA2 family multidrug resistance protein
MISPYSRPLTTPDLLGGWSIESAAGLAALSKEILRQAALIGYLNGFWLYTMASALAIPLVMFARRAPPSER